MILDERYRVIRPLGEGGMGTAYLVEDQRLSRECVVKAATLYDTAHREQFEHEAKLLANLSHANLPEVYDYFFERNHPYLVMQYIEGQTLDRLKEGRSAPFEAEQVLQWAEDLLDALAYLHSQHPPIIHRDIKPSNVCITPEETAVLLDFGIARRLSDTSTRTGAQAQSLHYSPIEQYRAEDVGYRPLIKFLEELRADGVHTGPYSDIYSLGATLYFALTLLTPPDACLRFLESDLPPIRERNPDVPEAVDHAIARAMVVDPRERCQSTSELAELLGLERRRPASQQVRRRSPRPLPTGNVSALDYALIYVPAGDFLMGSDDPQLKEACRPQHQVTLGAYCIGRHPVTNADYQRFIDNNPDYPVPYSPMRFAKRYRWDRESRTLPRGMEDHPVVLVTWDDAQTYCRWLSEVSGYRCRLPTEAEWETAARWDPNTNRARQYPWGDAFDEARCNVDVHGALRPQTSAVGRYSPAGDSAYGLVDMAGNVWEWTSSLYRPYPYAADDGREASDADGKRVIRGGSYNESPLAARSAWRKAAKPDLALADVGFRVVCEAGS
jgi:formylglycine-generating enzyme required for sulfatase activity/predicted Ser/Thr protein kinase